MSTQYFCGADVSKNSFSIAVKNETFILENSFSMDSKGFESMDKILSPYKDKLLIGMESTGIYHSNLFYFLKNKSYNCFVMNPYKMRQFFNFISDKPTKTDKKDAKAISMCVEFNRDKIETLSSQQKYQVRYLVREKETLAHQIAKTKTEIRTILCLVFPEIEKFSIFGSGMLSLLYNFPSAACIRSIPEKEFIKTGEKLINTRGRKLNIAMTSIYQLATTSIACCYPVYEQLLKMKIDTLNILTQQAQIIKQLIEKQAEKCFHREIEILTSIPGIGKESAMYFLSEVVDIKRFNGWRKLIGFCGLDPVIKQSGNYNGKWKLSKRGNKHARRIAFIMAGCVKRSCPYFRQYYIKKRNEGKSYTEAVVATSTKLLRTIYTLLKEDRLFI